MKGKRLRRLFAWLLCVTLLATCVPTAFAEDILPAYEATQSEPDGTACAHKASSVPLTDWVPVGEYMKTPETHAVAKAAFKVTVCEICGEELFREPTGGESEPRPEAHTFVDGVCTACGYAQPAEADEDGGDGESDGTGEPNRTGEPNESDKDDDSTGETPCQHEAAAEAQTDWAVTGGYRIGSDTHAAIMAAYSVTVCALCGEVLTREPTGEEAVADAEPHDFGEGAVCTVCGAANLKEGGGKELCPDGQHAFVGAVCTVCGAAANPSEGQSDETPASGVLLMSLDGECTHPNGVFGERQTPDVRPVPNGDGTHTVTYDWMLYSCPSCNNDTPIVLKPEYRKEKQPCNYNLYGEDDSCDECGFKNPCKHELTEQYERMRGATTTYNGDGTHTRTGDLYRTTVCVTCGKTKDELIKQNETVHEACDYGFGGHTCRVCKAELPEGVACAHTNRSYYWSFKDLTCVDNGNGTHTSTYTYVKYFYCEDCSHEGPDESGETTVQICIEPHRMRGQSFGSYAGTCIDCDYNAGSDYVDKSDTCGHPNERTVSITNYHTRESVIARDENGHTLEAWTEEYIFCPDCGWTQYRGLTGKKESRVEPHEYDEGDNYCYICGYVKKCGHSKTKTFYQPSGNKRVAEQIDENSHRITFDLVQYVTCLDCGETVSETIAEENLTRIEPHVFDRYSGGICETCGYVKPCDHAHTAVRRWLENTEYDNITFQPFDEKQHIARVSVAEWIVCTDCGVGLQVTYEPMQEVYVDHNFTVIADGWEKCLDCDYIVRSDCKHANHQTVEEVSDDDASVVPQADGHLVTYNRTFETVRCADCGIILSQTITGKSKTETLPHEFENGKCTVCGYQNDCKHDSAMTQDTYHTLVRNAKDIGGGKHTMLADIVTVKRCELCGEEWVVGLERNHTFTAEAHEYENGECWVCHASAPASTPSDPPKDGTESSSSGSGGSNSSSGGGVRYSGTTIASTTPPPAISSGAATQELAVSLNSIALQLAVSPSVTIEIVGAEEIMTDAEYQRFDRLSLSEQIMVVLSIAGVTQDITSALPPSATLLTADAQALIAQITGRVETGEAVPVQFKIGDVTVNGVPCKCVTITFVITMDGVQMRTTRSFYFDLTQGEWVAMDALAVV